MFGRLNRWIVRSLTQTRYVRRGRTRKLERVEVPPSSTLVFAIQFCLLALLALTAIEVVHILILHRLNEAVLGVMSSLIGTVIGTLIR